MTFWRSGRGIDRNLADRIETAWIRLAELSATGTRTLYLTPRGAISQSWGPDKVEIGTYNRDATLADLTEDVEAARQEVIA